MAVDRNDEWMECQPRELREPHHNPFITYTTNSLPDFVQIQGIMSTVSGLNGSMYLGRYVFPSKTGPRGGQSRRYLRPSSVH